MGGIYSGGLDTYRTVTEDDYRALFSSGMIVMDTNALLNLYRYHAGTREILIEVLARLKDRLWIPHQVMCEFHDGRVTVIDSRSEEADDAIADLSKGCAQLERTVRTWANRVGLPQTETERLVKPIGGAVEHVAARIREQAADDMFRDAENTAKDPIVQSLAEILENCVGSPLPPDELRAAKKEAQQRISDKRPPGWKDAGKRDNPGGDYLIWRQTLNEASKRSSDVLIVTGDVKDDWWRRERGESKGPLPELSHEMRSIANTRLFLLRPESFLLHASNLLGVSVSGESVKDVQRVTESRTRAGVQRLMWRKAGGRCSLCRAYLTTIVDGSRLSSAQLCHIKALAPGGPRFASGVQGLNDYDNLILLCTNCHMRVDSPNGGYTAEQLLRIKIDHEAWITANPEEAAQVNVADSLPVFKVAKANMGAP